MCVGTSGIKSSIIVAASGVPGGDIPISLSFSLSESIKLFCCSYGDATATGELLLGVPKELTFPLTELGVDIESEVGDPVGDIGDIIELRDRLADIIII
jgi:hypothetical protein